jgi:hypothetical protein
MRRHAATGAIAATGATALVAAIALATHSNETDPNDVRGVLDVREVRLSHPPGRHRFTVLTFGTWTVRRIWDTGHVFVMLDVRGDTSADHYVHVRSDGTRLRGHLWRVRSGRDTRVARVRITRPSSSAVSAWVRLTDLAVGKHRESYRWWVYTTYVGARCRATCIDRVPQAGEIQQALPSPSSSPSPAPTGPTGPSGPT